MIGSHWGGETLIPHTQNGGVVGGGHDCPGGADLAVGCGWKKVYSTLAWRGGDSVREGEKGLMFVKAEVGVGAFRGVPRFLTRAVRG